MNDRVEDPMQTKYNDPQATIIEVDELSASYINCILLSLNNSTKTANHLTVK